MTSDSMGSVSLAPEALAQPRLAHAALEAVITVDQQQRIVMINPAGLSMFGLTSEQALGMDLGRLIPPRLRAAHRGHVQRFSDSPEIERPMGQRGQVLGLRANGEEFPLEAAIFKSDVVLPSGTVSYTTALLRDLSEFTRMSSVIEQLNQRLRSVFERAPVAIWITERDRVVFANSACARLVGLQEPGQLVGRSIFELLAPDSREPVRSKLQNLEQTEGVSVLVGSLQRADGALLEVEMVVAVLPDHEHSFVQMVINDITLRTRERQNLLNSRRTLREFSASLVAAREEERRRIARELHDELGQRLTALKLEMIACQRDHPNLGVGERAQLMLDMLDETVASTRRISMDLRPLMLDDLGLADAIDWLVKEFRRRTGVEVDIRLGEGLRELSPHLATTLYRIVQEALTNITRHARATWVRVELGRTGDELRLAIRDNGVGFPNGRRSRNPGSFGLLGIRERVLMLGGQISVGNAPEGGALLVVRVPCVTPPVSARDDDLREAAEPLFDESTRGSLE
ncbi:MAG: PAS domain-containing sensor histidine kinase [Hydrogenophaga sp.]|uniref:PAS domain-containing sensor histidine kinase n=1 Tax=Hydrogenophaga sp. TaxID=1904254 RepID=UPI002734F521|nr:PAS domain-containing sensor histidine kinase [Hydrogenophaga sp.]MDP3351053.1 PAS domain-containing sensor histidine kinase [Hydrogenophaga sp.]